MLPLHGHGRTSCKLRPMPKRHTDLRGEVITPGVSLISRSGVLVFQNPDDNVRTIFTLPSIFEDLPEIFQIFQILQPNLPQPTLSPVAAALQSNRNDNAGAGTGGGGHTAISD